MTKYSHSIPKTKGTILVISIVSILIFGSTVLYRYQVDLGILKPAFQSDKFQSAYTTELREKIVELTKMNQHMEEELSKHNLEVPRKETEGRCKMSTCFSFSQCRLKSSFSFYFYEPETTEVTNDGYVIDFFLKNDIKEALKSNIHYTDDPKEACIFLVLVGEVFSEAETPVGILNETALKNLEHWGDEGRNHVLMYFALDIDIDSGKFFKNVDTGRAIIVQPTFYEEKFRYGFDLIVPPILGKLSGDMWEDCSPMLPAHRKHLISFQGELKSDPDSKENGEGLISILEKLEETNSEKFLFRFDCKFDNGPENSNDWSLCGSQETRYEILKKSTFALLIIPGPAVVSTTLFQTRLYEALRAGAIPVILGGDQVELPFSEIIEWRRAALFLPKARVTELHFLLRSVPESDLLSYRRQGRMIWEHYMSSVRATVDTMVATIRDRLEMPPKPAKTMKSVGVFESSLHPVNTYEILAESEDFLGFIEDQKSSPKFKRNFTSSRVQKNKIWNDWFNPFYLYPSLPFDPVLPTNAKFEGSDLDFRPIAIGEGGVGNDFLESLGGNYPYEQFTIIMLTYDREEVLIDSIAHLNGLPYLNKVIVVWNSPGDPAKNLTWPKIEAEVVFVTAGKNSLNNRFLPFDCIETEAIFSLDDDVLLDHEEIIFAFRVWRDNRDRMVGFPARFHPRHQDGTWFYSWVPGCEASMILTGAAFFHQYYLYMYSNWMPQAVRDKVDEFMNGEDIAMNFLVSHLTRKPPLKVTARTEFKNSKRKMSISYNINHSKEREDCMNFYSQVYGYTPLLSVQYRADSLMYNSDNETSKCFKFV